tara:strand:+ start:97789 stop:97914 length:126 start_codon:yes stop_codon:yes gene_type:complete
MHHHWDGLRESELLRNLLLNEQLAGRGGTVLRKSVCEGLMS